MYRINNNKSGTVNLQPIKDSIAKIGQDTVNISRMLNLTTFVKTNGYSPGDLYFDIEEFNTATGDSMWFSKPTMYNTMTLGYYHTLTNYSLTYSSTRLNVSEITELSRASHILKTNYEHYEGFVVDKPNIGIYPWTNTTYDGYIFKYNIPYTNCKWTMPTLPENVNSITESFIFAITNQGVSPSIYLSNMGNIDFFNFNNTTNDAGYTPLTGTYNLNFNSQELGTIDLINGQGEKFYVKSVKADIINHSALNSKKLEFESMTCNNLNILSPLSACGLYSCDIKNISGHSEANIAIQMPKIYDDLKIDNFNSLTIYTMLNDVFDKKDIILNNINLASLQSIVCADLNAENVKTISFTPSNNNIYIDNFKLNNVSTIEANLLSASGMIKYGEFNNMRSIYMLLPTATTFFTDGGLVDNVKSISISSGIAPNFTFNDVDYLHLYKASISSGELTAHTLRGQTAQIKNLENLSIDSLVSASYLSFDNIENLTINDAANCANNRMTNVDNGWFDVLPLGFDQGMFVNSWHVNNLSYSYINWINNKYMNVSNMTMYTGSQGWFGGLSTFIGDNLYNTSSSGNYTLKNVNDITINNLSFTGSNGISFEGFVNLDINKMNDNINNNLTVNGYRLMQNYVNINNFENLNSMRLINNGQVKLENGTAYDLFVSGDSQLMGALTLSSVEIENANFKNLSYADFGNGSCDELNVSNVLECEHPFSYCHDVYIDAAHSANLTNYVLSWQVSHVI